MRTQAAADPAATRRPVVEPQPSYLTGGSKKVVSLYLTLLWQNDLCRNR